MIYNRSVWFVLLVPLLILGCVHEPLAPETVDEADFIKAEPAKEPAPERIVRQVTKPVPLPGQLKPLPDAEHDPCPICTHKGAPRAETLKPHKHRSHEIIAHANREARQGPELEGYFNSVQVYNYADGALYQVYTSPMHETAIIFQPGEELTSASGGDTNRWVFANVTSGSPDGDQEVLLIKPTRSGLATNMVVTSNRRRYLLELRSYKETYMAAVSWHYPQEDFVMRMNEKTRKEEETSIITASDVSIDTLNFGYSITAKTPVRWKPVRVFDDGHKTYIQFPTTLSTTEAPALFILTGRKKVQLVNYRVRNTYYIVDRLFDAAELRLGTKKLLKVRIRRTEPLL